MIKYTLSKSHTPGITYGRQSRENSAFPMDFKVWNSFIRVLQWRHGAPVYIDLTPLQPVDEGIVSLIGSGQDDIAGMQDRRNWSLLAQRSVSAKEAAKLMRNNT